MQRIQEFQRIIESGDIGLKVRSLRKVSCYSSVYKPQRIILIIAVLINPVAKYYKDIEEMKAKMEANE